MPEGEWLGKNPLDGLTRAADQVIAALEHGAPLAGVLHAQAADARDEAKRVLIEHSVAIGASDAGVYVGQSEQIIVRHNRAENNVAGIERATQLILEICGGEPGAVCDTVARLPARPAARGRPRAARRPTTHNR